jgi:hypothetical protein
MLTTDFLKFLICLANIMKKRSNLHIQKELVWISTKKATPVLQNSPTKNGIRGFLGIS